MICLSIVLALVQLLPQRTAPNPEISYRVTAMVSPESEISRPGVSVVLRFSLTSNAREPRSLSRLFVELVDTRSGAVVGTASIGEGVEIPTVGSVVIRHRFVLHQAMPKEWRGEVRGTIEMFDKRLDALRPQKMIPSAIRY